MKSEDSIHLPAASPGSRKTVKVIRYGKPHSGPKAYIQAGLHADEAPGYLAAHHLEKLLDGSEMTGEIILVPAANPIGLSPWREDMLQGRFHMATSINFNRQHLDLVTQVAAKIENRLTNDSRDNVRLIRKAMTEALHAIAPEDEASYLKKELLLLAHDSDIVLDLHCDHDALLHLYMGTPLWPEGSDLAAYLQARVVLLAKNSGDNPFDEACSRPWWDLASRFPHHPIPPACFSVTVELRGTADTDPGIAEQDALRLHNFLQRRGVVAGSPPELPALCCEATPLTGVDYVKAESPGIVVYTKKPGQWIQKGEEIARIVNPLPDDGEKATSPVMSKTEGILFTRNCDRFARPGRILAKIAGTAPLRQDDTNLLTQ